ncbi:MAG: ATP-binding protein [Armatimonadota bacterium]
MKHSEKAIKVAKGFVSSVTAFATGAVIIGLIVSFSLYNRYQGEIQSIFRVYRLEESDRVNLEKFKVESAFQSLKGSLIAASHSPELQHAISDPGSNDVKLASEILPTFASQEARGLFVVVPSKNSPRIIAVGEGSRNIETLRSGLKNLLEQYSQSYPDMSRIWLQDYPASVTNLVATPDPKSLVSRVEKSFVYGIPLFDQGGRFSGVLAVSLDASFLERKLSSSDRAIVEKNKRFVAYPAGFGTVESFWPAVQRGQATNSTIYGQALGLDMADTNGKWVLWSARFDTDFWSRSDVAVLKQNLVSSCLMTWTLLGFGIFLVAKIRRKQEDRFQGLLRNSTEIILLCDEVGEINQVGGNTRQLIGWKSEELSGVNLSLFLSAETRRDLSDLLDIVTRTPHATQSIQVQIEKPDKTLRWHELVATNLRHDPEVDGIVITLRNIEAQKAGEMMLIQAKDSAERANVAKSEFLSRMSHELRTPLNAILGFSQLLQMSDLQEHDRESVDQVLKSGRHLLGLINDILDISRIETNNISVSKEPVLVSEVVQDCVSNVQLLAKSRGIEIELKVPDDVYFRADRQRIAQVVINLLSNAVKYNREEGKVLLEVTKTQSDVYLSVTDTGNGIADELLPRLFTPFDRLGADRSRVEGTGLGLSLSKTLIEAMDGRINVLSKVGEGTTFVIALPAAQAKSGVTLKLVNGFDENEIRILYIEDNEVNIDLMQRVFADYRNIKLLEAREGWLGVAVAREQVPDLILLDNNLPDIDAVRVIEELRSNPVTRNIDIFVISADITSERISACLEAGAKQFIQKPIDVNNFLSALEQNLKAA